jgi:hypothetical protein
MGILKEAVGRRGDDPQTTARAGIGEGRQFVDCLRRLGSLSEQRV